jgi:hypothetical protein
MGRRFLLLLMLAAGLGAAPAAYSACDVKSPAQEIFAHPELMKMHATFQDYEIRVFDSEDCDAAMFKDRSGLEILKAGKRVYAETGYGYAVGYPLEQDQPPDSVKLKVGDDITGEGQPELLVSEWTGGAHCCYSFAIFRLGTDFRKIQDISLFDADESAFVRRPGVKSLVLNTYDYSAFAYFPTSFAGSPAGRVLLSFQEGRFRLDQWLMKANAPAKGETDKCAALFRKSRDWKQGQSMGMWYYATDLIYTGNQAQALGFLKQSWGGSAADRDKYLGEYQARLTKSVYYPQLKLLQQMGSAASDQKIDWTKQCFEYLQG